MCIEHSMTCKCGGNKASLHFRDDVMTSEVIDGIYCPECSSQIVLDHESMIGDNGWVIAYDMDIARFLGKKLPTEKITPEFMFDEGYCTWSGLYPTDHADSVKERQEILPLAKADTRRYLAEFRRWSLERMERLSSEGWRKANEGKQVAF